MPSYEVPEVVEVEFSQLELPSDVPVDEYLNEKPLAECSREEVQHAVRTFTLLARHTQREIEQRIEQHVELRRRLAHLQAYLENFEELNWVRRQ